MPRLAIGRGHREGRGVGWDLLLVRPGDHSGAA